MYKPYFKIFSKYSVPEEPIDGSNYIVSTNVTFSDADKVDGSTQLHIAAAKGNAKQVEKLICEYNNVNARTTEGLTPLHYAAMLNNTDIAILLLKKGASSVMRTKSGQTPSDLAQLFGLKNMILLLNKYVINEKSTLPLAQKISFIVPEEDDHEKPRSKL